MSTSCLVEKDVGQRAFRGRCAYARGVDAVRGQHVWPRATGQSTRVLLPEGGGRGPRLRGRVPGGPLGQQTSWKGTQSALKLSCRQSNKSKSWGSRGALSFPTARHLCSIAMHTLRNNVEVAF